MMNPKRFLTILLIFLIILLAVLLVINSGGEVSIGNKENVSMAVTGDVMFARNMEGVLSLDSSPFEAVSNVTSKVDLLLINFENAATNSENAVKGDIPLKCNPSYVPLAKANENTVAALANNHVFDYGIEGMHDTVKYLKDAGLTVIGAGDSEDEAHQAVTKEVNGRKITILNYMDSNNFAEYDHEVMPPANGSNPGYSSYNSADAKKQIEEHKDSDMIVAYLHFGNEYSTSPNEDQIRIAHDLIDYGADVVIGSHPHVTQGIEMYKGKPIFYSLGNFIFDQSSEETKPAYIVQIDLVDDTGKCTVYPVYISDFLPQFMDKDTGEELLKGLTPNPKEMKVENGVGKIDFNLSGD